MNVVFSRSKKTFHGVQFIKIETSIIPENFDDLKTPHPFRRYLLCTYLPVSKKWKIFTKVKRPKVDEFEMNFNKLSSECKKRKKT